MSTTPWILAPLLISIIDSEYDLATDAHFHAFSMTYHAVWGLNHPQTGVKFSAVFQFVWLDPYITGWLGDNSNVSNDGSALKMF